MMAEPFAKEGEEFPLGHMPSVNEPPGSDVLPDDPNAAEAPTLDSLYPASCYIGDPDFTLYVTGSGMSADSVITFAGHDEPTTYNDADGTVSTLVKPSLWQAPATVDCSVKNGTAESNVLPFEFMQAAGG